MVRCFVFDGGCSHCCCLILVLIKLFAEELRRMDTSSNLVADANEVLEFKLVRSPEDLVDESTSFRPEMSHQVFGDSEKIFGYKDLHVRLYYTAASLQTYLSISYSDKVDPAKNDGVKPDNIERMLSEVLAPNYLTNLGEFVKHITKDEKFIPYGELLHSFIIGDDGDSSKRTFQVYYCETNTPGFLDFHKRLQTFLLWYVDAASFIDVDDEQWTFFILYEKYISSSGSPQYSVAGLCTVYRYYAYPLNTRPRISQALVLPPFQRMGLGAQLLQAVYNHFVPLKNVVDITVEDPSEDFQRIRDYVDSLNCQDLPAFQPDKLVLGYNKEMALQAKDKLKINARQARRIYEILRLKNTNTKCPELYQKYRLDVKNRLNAPYQKKKNEMKKLKKVLNADEYAATLSMSGQEESYQRLNSQYKSLEEFYRRVIDRLEAQ